MGLGVLVSTLGNLLRVSSALDFLGGKRKAWSLTQIRSALLVIIFGVMVLQCCSVVFVYGEAHAYNAPDLHICIRYFTNETCAGEHLASRKGTEQVRAKRPCVWDPDAPLTHWPCTNHKCWDYIGFNKTVLTSEFLTVLY